ncbi:MAG: sigma-54-dependent transcriptional regulator [Blastocatellales bacterium]
MQSHETRTNTTERRALIIASNQATTTSLRKILEQAEWRVEVGRDQDEFNLLAEQASWLLVIMICERGSSEMLKMLQSLQPAIASETTSAIVIAEQLSISDAILCTRNGALDYLSWPIIPSQLLEIAERAYRLAEYAALKSQGEVTGQEKSENARAAPNQSGRAMIGSSVAMIELSKQIVRIARSPELRVLINGETGTGKEVVARLLHDLSSRNGPFLPVNCAATVESLLESDLFGHEKGAFTGAHATKKGLWEEAGSGTLFLDEITETSPTVQAKLLRVLQEGVIRRVGSNREIKVSARVIAASNRDIEQAVREGTFRRDLYYRLGQVLRLPPLRERLEDIPLLVAHFCQRAARKIVVTDDAMELLCAYEWPGNVRELESVIQQLITFSGRFVFREDVLRHINVANPQHRKVNLPFWSAMNSLRRDEWPSIRDLRNWYVTQAYLYFGQESVVARYLGMDARTVSTILEEVAESGESLRGVIDSDDKE